MCIITLNNMQKTFSVANNCTAICDKKHKSNSDNYILKICISSSDNNNNIVHNVVMHLFFTAYSESTVHNDFIKCSTSTCNKILLFDLWHNR